MLCFLSVFAHKDPWVYHTHTFMCVRSHWTFSCAWLGLHQSQSMSLWCNNKDNRQNSHTVTHSSSKFIGTTIFFHHAFQNQVLNDQNIAPMSVWVLIVNEETFCPYICVLHSDPMMCTPLCLFLSKLILQQHVVFAASDDGNIGDIAEFGSAIRQYWLHTLENDAVKSR